jgi:chromosome segregation protein
MKIHKLELVGFKSFVDRTVLHFGHDVLGIVGPNGCGKSNIVDAIRWCMGEQSARHLRGRSMDDVIFSGSDSRTPNEFVEVTLTFVNDLPDEVPSAYRDYAEIAVTRRLTRVGDSEYLINKTPVRLRDVTDLFLGTGAGTKAYSIVEQGKVGLIVSAKPEDRRLLIEEAAGITRFKSRKKQAERKMELTQQNLLRVGDIVSEIERSLASLKRQAAKAERYVTYRNELEDLQLYGASHRYLELFGYIQFEGAEVQAASAACEGCRSEVEASEAGLDVMRTQAKACEEDLNRAQAETFDAEASLSAEQAGIDRANDRLAGLSRRQHDTENGRREMGADVARLEADQGALQVEIATLTDTEETQKAQMHVAETALGDLAVAHDRASLQVAETGRVIASAQAEVARAEAKLSSFDRRGSEIAARRDKLGAERTSLEQSQAAIAARLSELLANIEDLRAGHRQALNDRQRHEETLAGLKEQIRAYEASFEEAKAEMSAKRSRRVALEEMHARLDGIGSGAKAIVETGDPSLRGLVADHVSAPAELTQALAGLLGPRVQSVVVGDLERGVALLDDLARAGRGRATIVALRPSQPVAKADASDTGAPRLIDSLRYAAEDEPLVRSLIGDAVVVSDLPAALALRHGGERAACVTLAGSVVHPDGRIEGGQSDEVAAGIIESKREARELGQRLEALETVVSERLDRLQRSRSDIVAAGQALDAARQKAHTSELDLAMAEKDHQKSESQLEAVVRRLAALAVEEEELISALAEAQYEREQCESALSEGRARIDSAEREHCVFQATLAQARERLDVQRKDSVAMSVALASVCEKLSAAVAARGRLARSAQELRDRIARAGEDLTACAEAIAETAAQLACHEDAMRAAEKRLSEARQRLLASREVVEQGRAAVVEKEVILKGLRAVLEETREGWQAHEMVLREKSLELDHLKVSIRDRFRGLSIAAVVGDYHLRPPPNDETRARCDELARLLERMGSVNLDAVREHAEAEERFTFYATQRADLESALADLQRAIQQMNRESRRLFQDTFDAVNARFKEIFPRMFRGGRAELRMTDPQDLLETGIDIVAQPPGKRLSSIELMSGGEKALTAVSLIFAMFQTKPSPFCILDEVDAPLDEANVVRYNEMVRSMTDRSQFILVTHVKRTMQMVDVLYGVTMPEPGVSKIVSVKINEAPRRSQLESDAAAAVA